MHYEHINYISSDSIVAEVKQELKSYFEAGAISEVLIPTYIDQALKKLRVFALNLKKLYYILLIINQNFRVTLCC